MFLKTCSKTCAFLIKRKSIPLSDQATRCMLAFCLNRYGRQALCSSNSSNKYIFLVNDDCLRLTIFTDQYWKDFFITFRVVFIVWMPV